MMKIGNPFVTEERFCCEPQCVSNQWKPSHISAFQSYANEDGQAKAGMDFLKGSMRPEEWIWACDGVPSVRNSGKDSSANATNVRCNNTITLSKMFCADKRIGKTNG
jgi:hypothetical protein